MAGSIQSIFNRKPAAVPPPEKHKPLMRVLEPRILLDAAAAETAIDIAGQAAHSQLADDYMANANGENPATTNETESDPAESSQHDNSSAESDAISTRRTDREIVFVDAAVEDRDALIASLFDPG